MFIIYVNDLPNQIPPEIKIKLFADDLKIYTIYKNKIQRQKLNRAIIEIENWSKTWGLPINPHKTFAMFLGKNNHKEQYKLNNITINEVESIRDLGIIIDNKLTFF